MLDMTIGLYIILYFVIGAIVSGILKYTCNKLNVKWDTEDEVLSILIWEVYLLFIILGGIKDLTIYILKKVFK